jgi:hypothetical protein
VQSTRTPTTFRGYEHFRRAIDPLARACICILVAQYALDPDPRKLRAFQAVGAFLERSEEPELQIAHVIARLYVDLATSAQDSATLFFDAKNSAIFLSRGIGVTRSPTRAAKVSPDQLRDTLPAMAAAGLGRMWTGLGAEVPAAAPSKNGSSDFSFSPGNRPRMLLLNLCLRPLDVR